MGDELLASHPDIQDGDVCFAGTRIRVSAIWGFASCGYTAEQIAQEYPWLAEDKIRAALDMVAWQQEEQGIE